ncbi:hypothetical protein [Geothrix limicola]|uniref:hypothetical protein n=1 Tax=Geothrix limicola TaxID=2927978 RepID=UPI002554CAA3|nr:hypothetical protein [Geothrix limicola]
MKIQTRFGEVELIDEGQVGYSFGSQDNKYQYPSEINFSEEPRPPVVLGIKLNSAPLIAFGGYGIGIQIGPHLSIALSDRLFVVFKRWLICIDLATHQLLWSIEADPINCFGLYHSSEHSALITHGELEVARFDEDGAKLWHTSGADIFSEGFKLEPDSILVVDFNGTKYRYSYDGGLRMA